MSALHYPQWPHIVQLFEHPLIINVMNIHFILAGTFILPCLSRKSLLSALLFFIPFFLCNINGCMNDQCRKTVDSCTLLCQLVRSFHSGALAGSTYAITTTLPEQSSMVKRDCKNKIKKKKKNSGYLGCRPAEETERFTLQLKTNCIRQPP